MDWSAEPPPDRLERAAKVHADFVGIHPFIDGNERTSRLLINLELLKVGYPPCIIIVENRLVYYDALDQWMAYGKTEAFIQLNRTGFVGESIFWETIPMTKLKYTPEIREKAVQLLIESGFVA